MTRPVDVSALIHQSVYEHNIDQIKDKLRLGVTIADGIDYVCFCLFRFTIFTTVNIDQSYDRTHYRPAHQRNLIEKLTQPRLSEHAKSDFSTSTKNYAREVFCRMKVVSRYLDTLGEGLLPQFMTAMRNDLINSIQKTPGTAHVSEHDLNALINEVTQTIINEIASGYFVADVTPKSFREIVEGIAKFSNAQGVSKSREIALTLRQEFARWQGGINYDVYMRGRVEQLQTVLQPDEAELSRWEARKAALTGPGGSDGLIHQAYIGNLWALDAELSSHGGDFTGLKEKLDEELRMICGPTGIPAVQAKVEQGKLPIHFINLFRSEDHFSQEEFFAATGI